MPDRRVNIADLVANFRAHIKAYKSKDTKEAEVRQQFIDPFWRALGCGYLRSRISGSGGGG